MKQCLRFIKNIRLQCTSTVFVAIYSLAMLLVYNSIFWGKIITAITFENISDYLFLITYFIVLLTLSFIFFSVFFFKYTTKFLAILFVIINSAAFYFMHTYHIAIDKVMILNVFATDTKEAMDLLNYKLVFTILLLGILPSVVILKTKIIYQNLLRETFNRLVICVIALIIGLGLIGVQYRAIAVFTRTHKSNFDHLLPRNYIGSIIKIVKSSIKAERKLLLIGNDVNIANNNDTLVVLVIGETARRANFSLYGYEIPTNPLLKNDNVMILQNANSCGTSTKISVPCMLSHLNRHDFSRNHINYEFMPSILARAKVNVLYKDNNFGGSYETANNVENINTKSLKIPQYCSTGECVDGILLEGLKEYISTHPENTLIVLHENGSHGPRYNKRYPKEFEKFTPVCTNNDITKCSQEELINAYNNTILYGDYILHSTIQIAQQSKRNAVVIYVSDHGESLGENNMYLHGFPYALAPNEQKEIPFIVWTSQSFKQNHNISPTCFGKKEEYSHDNIFHSVLGAFNAQTSLYEKDLDIFAECKQ